MKDVSYVRGHRLALAFSASMILTGLLVLARPETSAGSLSLSELPLWTTVAYGLASLVGGAASVFGLVRVRPDYESGGMVLLAAVQAVAMITAIAALGFEATLLGTVLRAGLMIGCLCRGIGVAKEGQR